MRNWKVRSEKMLVPFSVQCVICRWHFKRDQCGWIKTGLFCLPFCHGLELLPIKNLREGKGVLCHNGATWISCWTAWLFRSSCASGSGFLLMHTLRGSRLLCPYHMEKEPVDGRFFLFPFHFLSLPSQSKHVWTMTKLITSGGTCLNWHLKNFIHRD